MILDVTNQSNNINNHRGPGSNQERPRFDLILVSYTELFPQLLQNHLIEKVLVELIKPPFPDGTTPTPIKITTIGHKDILINAINEETGGGIKIRIKEVKTPLEIIYEALIKVRIL